ncbi:hypothetical protein MTP03_29280 [Tsukamurella sp. PLM1]|nr:hypothetical protein MTP03_29280 [Tsukamurella sp. PLM1]
MVGPREPFEEVAVDEPPREPDAHPHAGLRRRIEVRGHQIVELPVEVADLEQGQHPGDREFDGGLCRLGGAGTGHAGGDRCQRPAAARSASTRSVCSHGRSISVRPK